MVSFRNQQFPAILWGVIIADALSHRRLAWTSGSLVKEDTGTALGESNEPFTGAVMSDRWCHQIAAQLTHADNLPNLTTETLQQIANADSPAALLAVLPNVLVELDQLESLLNVTSGNLPLLAAHSASIAFYQYIGAVLNDDLAIADHLRQRVKAIAQTDDTPLVQTIALAFDQVSLAHGDYALAIGQSLEVTAPMAGLPLLTGILSACQVSMPGIPVTHRLAIQAPDAPLRTWLQARWQLATESSLRQWTQGLWQRWLGCDVTAPSRGLSMAVKPVMPSG